MQRNNSGSLKVEIKLKSERAPGGVYLKLKYLERKGEPSRRLTVKRGRVPGGVGGKQCVYFELGGYRQDSSMEINRRKEGR